MAKRNIHVINQAKVAINGEENFVREVTQRSEKRNITLTPNHTELIEAIAKNDLVFAVGSAGTGKTFMSVLAGIVALEYQYAERIICSRPAVEAGEKLGFLPGDQTEKVAPYMQPIYDAFTYFYDLKKLKAMVADGSLEIAPIAFMRGRTLNNAFIILDESQNATYEQLHMMFTRLGRKSKMVVTGDLSQIDLPPGKSGLAEALERLEPVNGIKIVRLSEIDNLRHPLVAEISNAMNRYANPLEPNRAALLNRPANGSRVTTYASGINLASPNM